MNRPIVEKYNSEKFKIGLQYFPPDLPDGETIVDIEVKVEPEGLTLEGNPTIDGNTVKQMISGGKRWTDYSVNFNVMMSTGNNFKNTIIIRIIF